MFSGMLAGLLKVAAVAVLTAVVAVALVAGACGGGDDSNAFGQGEPSVTGDDEAIGGALRVSSRADLSVSVDREGAVPSDAQVNRVRDALGGALADDNDSPYEYPNPTVGEGCPPPVVLFGEKLDYGHRYSLVPARLLESMSDASRHRVHVYVLPSTVYESTFGGDPYATTAEERICEGDVCLWVTQGLYITPATNEDTIRRALRAMLGLFTFLPDLTEYSQFCLSGTPEEWCYSYRYCQGVPTYAKCEDQSALPTTRPGTPTSQLP